MFQIVTIRLSYKLQWPEQRMIVNQSADWGKEDEINISPDNIEVRIYEILVQGMGSIKIKVFSIFSPAPLVREGKEKKRKTSWG